nr:PREDICTED: uncharacterized protein LOC107983251 [Anolis carolinensis]|eukprot:XP_016851497.1 PREDICTED: uncharacterized protein LOC107983251 [Anolis carolinensis]
MANLTPRYKNEKETKTQNTGTVRKSSFQEESMFKDIMKELQRISEKQDQFQEQIQKMSMEMTEDLGEMKKDMSNLKQEITEVRKEVKEMKAERQHLEKTQSEQKLKMDQIEENGNRLGTMQERLEQQAMEFQLRYRKIIIQLTAKLMDWPEEDVEDKIDRVYRISTNYARRNKADRDVIVNFTKKIIRDDILKLNNVTPTNYKGKKVAILKEIPSTMLRKRRKYMFLTEELKKLKIRFRWEKGEGIMTTYKGERFWLTSEEKAREFYKRLKRDTRGDKTPEQGNPTKKAREESPENMELLYGLAATNLDLVEEEEEVEEDEDQKTKGGEKGEREDGKN